MGKIDIKVTELKKQPFDGFQSSQLILNFKGKHVYPSVTNSLRRLALSEVPTYAFIADSIIIEENTSVFDNDEMRNRLEQFTIPNVNVPVLHLDEELWREVDYSDKNRPRHENDNINLEMVVNFRNNTVNNVSVTTNDATVYQDGENVSDKFDSNFPWLITKLKPGQVFKATCKAVLGKGLRNNVWSSVATAYHSYDSEQDINLTLESQGQLDEYDILVRSCHVMKTKIKNLINKLSRNLDKDDIANQKMLLVRFDKEDHTLGEIVNEFLQESDDVIYSGVQKPDHLKNEINIKMKSVKNNPLKPLLKTMEDVIGIYDHMEEQFRNLGKKFITV